LAGAVREGLVLGVSWLHLAGAAAESSAAAVPTSATTNVATTVTVTTGERVLPPAAGAGPQDDLHEFAGPQDG
jgi:hypothetical protein